MSNRTHHTKYLFLGMVDVSLCHGYACNLYEVKVLSVSNEMGWDMLGKLHKNKNFLYANSVLPKHLVVNGVPINLSLLFGNKNNPCSVGHCQS